MSPASTPQSPRALQIIVVEDHDDLRLATVDALSAMGHVVLGVDSAEALDQELASFRADLLVIDINLPGEDGFALAQRLSQAEPEIRIIIVSARTRSTDKLAAYRSGADIYLTKPTSIEELAAAIESLARRLRRSQGNKNLFSLHPETLQLHGPAAVVNISDQDYTVLSALAQANDYRLATTELLACTDKPVDELSKRALEVHITRLRKKFEQAGAAGPSIKAIRGSGYQLCLPLVINRSTS